ncbi:hypothetical protein [Vibrio chagasii]|uniref:hypothetical protein n=1 Tax=Vibrio chagasii TaxID=170679 RepID=UPI003DA0E801
MIELFGIPILFFSFFTLSTLVFLFNVSPFRYSQIVILFAVFSFVVRPISSALCDTFYSFYYFDKTLYIEGVYISLAYFFFYMMGLILFVRRKINLVPVTINILEIKRLLTLLLIIILFVDIACLVVFGVAILPGIRTTGLSKAASGAQVFFAVTSSLTFVATALCVLLLIQDKKSLMSSLIKLCLCFALSMIFYQRGSFIMGGIFGLFLVACIDRNALFKDIFRKIVLFVSLTLVILYGRTLVSQAIAIIFPQDTNFTEFVKYEQPLECKISNKANQEHDQVWPTLITYTEQEGYDFYKNIIASISRPFLSADDREKYGLMTSVDTLNIFNDRDTYLNKNFGFSLSVVHYHYYSIGLVSVLFAFFLGSITSLLENKMYVHELGRRGILKLAIIYQIILLFNSAFDERLKWVVINILLITIVIKFLYPIIYREKNVSFNNSQ